MTGFVNDRNNPARLISVKFRYMFYVAGEWTEIDLYSSQIWYPINSVEVKIQCISSAFRKRKSAEFAAVALTFISISLSLGLGFLPL